MNILQEKPARMLQKLHQNQNSPLDKGEVTASSLARAAETTYAHSQKIVSDMQDQGLITREEKGRSKVIELTEKGEQLAEKVSELRNLLENQMEVTA